MADEILYTDEYEAKQKLVLDNSAMVRFKRGANHVGLLVEGNTRVFDMWIEGHNETVIKVKDFADVKSLTTNTPDYLILSETDETSNIDFNANGLLKFSDFSTDTPDFIELIEPEDGGIEINFTGDIESADEGFIAIENSNGTYIVNFVAEITTNTPSALEITKGDNGWTIDYVKADTEITTTTTDYIRITTRDGVVYVDYIGTNTDEVPVAYLIRRTGEPLAEFTDSTTIQIAGGNFFAIINRSEINEVVLTEQTITYQAGYFVVYNKSTNVITTVNMTSSLSLTDDQYIIGKMGVNNAGNNSIKTVMGSTTAWSLGNLHVTPAWIYKQSATNISELPFYSEGDGDLRLRAGDYFVYSPNRDKENNTVSIAAERSWSVVPDGAILFVDDYGYTISSAANIPLYEEAGLIGEIWGFVDNVDGIQIFNGYNGQRVPLTTTVEPTYYVDVEPSGTTTIARPDTGDSYPDYTLTCDTNITGTLTYTWEASLSATSGFQDPSAYGSLTWTTTGSTGTAGRLVSAGSGSYYFRCTVSNGTISLTSETVRGVWQGISS